MGEQLPYKQWVTGSSPVAPTRTVRKNNMREWLSGRASPCQGECRGFESRLPLQKFFRTVFLRRYSQVVRPGSAKPSSPGSNPGGASKEQPPSEGGCLRLNAPIGHRNNVTRLTQSVTIAIPSLRSLQIRAAPQRTQYFDLIPALYPVDTGLILFYKNFLETFPKTVAFSEFA